MKNKKYKNPLGRYLIDDEMSSNYFTDIIKFK